VPFVKMHGIGNDYIFFDAITHPHLATRRDWPAQARRLSHRHTGIGSDGIVLVTAPPAGARTRFKPHAAMRMFNADGSESEMCGNGLRCVAKLLHDDLGLTHQPLRVHTGAGVLTIDYAQTDGLLTEATIDMGEPALDIDAIPANRRALTRTTSRHVWALRVPGHRRPLHVTLVNMGNPHAVLFVDTLNEAQTAAAMLGPILEHHPAFPRRANIHFVVIQPGSRAAMVTWERGSGLTQACGTGACAVLVASVLTGRLPGRATLSLPGGDLHVAWDEASGRVLLTGPAAVSFRGTVRLDAPVKQGVRTGKSARA
jgi:diaminopimelate epimerase